MNEIERKKVAGDIAVDTHKGLSSDPKYLLPKYFYDKEGSVIFQEIMRMPEYYLTACEFEILTTSTDRVTRSILGMASGFDLIELGSGDGMKTLVLLHSLAGSGARFRYIPIDISPVANNYLIEELRRELTSLRVEAITGDYFGLFNGTSNGTAGIGENGKVILFLGSNIGNFSNDELQLFLGHLSSFSAPGDKVVIGFDLKKSPGTIMKAYDDPHGITRRFNLNHLVRLNRELHADFNLNNFEHFTQYDPCSSEVRSYLVSTVKQDVFIGALEQGYSFRRWEPVFMELSRKFELDEIGVLARDYGFEVEQHLTDRRDYFADSIWIKA
jgi:L-histidine Nalpha-methyltransferase